MGSLKANTIQITNDNLDNSIQFFKDDIAVGSRRDLNEGDLEIFFYDISSGIISQITDNNYTDAEPFTGNGYIVWREGRGGNTDSYQEIFLYDINSGITTQITDNDKADSSPKVDGSTIVWPGGYDANNDYEIFLYDINSGITTQITDNDHDDNSPYINAGQVVWSGFDGNDNEIFLYNITTGITTQITDNNYADISPKINNNAVVWISDSGNNNEIFLYNITTGITTQITDNLLYKYAPRVDDGRVIWSGSDGNDYEMFLYDIYSGIPTQVTDNNYSDGNKEVYNINGDMVVWRGSDGNDYEIFLYDINSGITTQITDNDKNDGSPQIVGAGKVIWSGWDGEDYEIFQWTEPAPINQTPILDPVGNKTVSEGQLLQFTITATDPDNDNLVFSAANLPIGSVFDPQSATFYWTPGYNQAGNYVDVEFSVTDNGTPIELDTELITITVGNINRSPVFDVIGSQEVLEDENLTFTVTASDPDGDDFTLSAQGMPSGATFNQNTGIFSWTPTLNQEGNYVVTFNAIDNGTPSETGSIDVVITVGDNPTPVEQAENLVEEVVNYNFPDNVENSYLANLKKVAKFIEDGKIEPAINQLSAFISKVEEDYGSSVITQQERSNLISLAESLLNDIQ